MDGDEQEERDGTLVPIGLEDHRDADENRIRLTRRETGDHPGNTFDPKEAPSDHGGQEPDYGNADKIGNPVAPGLDVRDLGTNEGAEDEAGQGQGEDEFGQPFAGSLGNEACLTRDMADADQAEDRQHDREKLEHGLYRNSARCERVAEAMLWDISSSTCSRWRLKSTKPRPSSSRPRGRRIFRGSTKLPLMITS